MKRNKTIAIIPARGGSKRLPQKNIQTLGDYPLLVHSILYAQQHDCIDAIYVSTDDESIKTIAEQYGVKVIERPKHLADDKASTVSALKHVLESINNPVDTVILLQPTNPLRPKTLLTEAYQKFIESNSDSLMTVSQNHHKLGKIVNHAFVPYNYQFGQRSQDLEPLYYENGLLYISKASLILNSQILGDQNFPFVVEHPFATVDIDTEEDFRYAEFLLKHHSNA